MSCSDLKSSNTVLVVPRDVVLNKSIGVDLIDGAIPERGGLVVRPEGVLGPVCSRHPGVKL